MRDNTLGAALMTVLVSQAMAFGVSAATEPTVACFSDDGAGGQFSVWVYEGHADWQTARASPAGWNCSSSFRRSASRCAIP